MLVAIVAVAVASVHRAHADASISIEEYKQLRNALAKVNNHANYKETERCGFHAGQQEWRCPWIQSFRETQTLYCSPKRAKSNCDIRSDLGQECFYPDGCYQLGMITEQQNFINNISRRIGVDLSQKTRDAEQVMNVMEAQYDYFQAQVKSFNGKKDILQKELTKPEEVIDSYQSQKGRLAYEYGVEDYLSLKYDVSNYTKKWDNCHLLRLDRYSNVGEWHCENWEHTRYYAFQSWWKPCWCAEAVVKLRIRRCLFAENECCRADAETMKPKMKKYNQALANLMSPSYTAKLEDARKEYSSLKARIETITRETDDFPKTFKLYAQPNPSLAALIAPYIYE